jgi:hypothetical protein
MDKLAAENDRWGRRDDVAMTWRSMWQPCVRDGDRRRDGEYARGRSRASQEVRLCSSDAPRRSGRGGGGVVVRTSPERRRRRCLATVVVGREKEEATETESMSRRCAGLPRS